jgi:ATP-binding cassette subfamily C (CFTR/MRP) protein 1
METSIGAVARIRAFASETPREESDDEVEPPEDWPSRGEVKIMNASARYRKDKEATALSNINLTISPGEKIGICGRTGSGKSSLVLTLFRMLDLCEGQICIDGQDIATLTHESVRRQLVVITDAPFIMPGTVRHNLDPDGDSTDDEITAALKKSQIWDAIDAKGGLDADMEMCKLSLGQRQLFNIAGAILKKAGKVLVMDEATSRYTDAILSCCIQKLIHCSIDHETDKIVQNVIREEFLQYTIIYIAHRLDTILEFDRVAVMDKGQIVECDDPRILLQRSSLFKSLYDSFRLKQSVDKVVEPVNNQLEDEISLQV